MGYVSLSVSSIFPQLMRDTCMYVCTYNTLSYMYMYYMYLGVLKECSRKTYYTALVLSVVAIMLYIYYGPMYIYVYKACRNTVIPF